ncbi:hypothetical protein PMIN01_08050 [Paraphaeosphaeria minitans]|uniref:Uncharacterized protein n=1 Tax=Paraphaeosphaeria minitans TaxID=565426 RepID=A0A9P6GDQ8_9PLEO|nr:hypothetical protein PMIN01_08050 [Paraphaeosphaeria minitans]
MIRKLPAELLSHIAELSWPCALQKPLIISEEGHSLLEFMKRGKGNVMDSLLYTGGEVIVARLKFLGSAYVSGLSIEEKTSRGCPKGLSIALIRNEVGLIDVNFQGEFRLSKRGYWYKRIQTRSDHLHLRVHHKHIITDLEMASVDETWSPYWDDQLTPRVSTWYTAKPNSPPPSFMKYTRLSDDAQGVAVLCALDGIVSIAINAHNDKFRIDEGPSCGSSERTVWIYFPLGKDELITGAWMRELKRELNNNVLIPHHPVLVVREFMLLVTSVLLENS